MESLKLRSRVGADGLLTLQVPVSLRDMEVEVDLVIHPLSATNGNGTQRAGGAGWPPGFFEATFGSFADDPLERPEQGEFEVRDALQ